MPKLLPSAVSAVLIREHRCMGGGPTAAPGSPSSNTATALQLPTAQRSEPCSHLQRLRLAKSMAMLPFTAMSERSNLGIVREQRWKKNLEKK